MKHMWKKMEILTFWFLTTFRWPDLFDPIFDGKSISALTQYKRKSQYIYQLLITMLSQNTENRKVVSQLNTEGL